MARGFEALTLSKTLILINRSWAQGVSALDPCRRDLYVGQQAQRCGNGRYLALGNLNLLSGRS